MGSILNELRRCFRATVTCTFFPVSTMPEYSDTVNAGNGLTIVCTSLA